MALRCCAAALLLAVAAAVADAQYTLNGCIVDVNATHYYDFAPLSSTDLRIVGGAGYTYVLRPCGAVTSVGGGNCPLGRTANCQTNTATGGVVFNVGAITPNPTAKLTAGTMMLSVNYLGGDSSGCPTARNTVIEYTCDPTNSQPAPVFVAEGPTCSYKFTWRTSIGCMLRKSSCSGTLNGVPYNLEPLAGMTYNVLNTITPSLVEHIAVCGEVVSTPGCASNAAVCESSIAAPDVFTTRGINPATVTQQAVGRPLVMTFTKSTTSCTVVTIDFLCSPLSGRGAPVINYASECLMQFSWYTAYACTAGPTPLPPLPPPPDASCVVLSDKTKHDALHTVDLRLLASKVWAVPNSQYPASMEHIALCGATTASVTGCPSTAAVCELTNGRGLSFGVNPAVTMTNGDAIVMSFTAADAARKCYRSEVSFVCSNDTGLVHTSNSPDGCLQHFNFDTPFACPQPTCELDVAGRRYDISLLGGRVFSNQNVLLPDFTTHLKLCGSTITAEDATVPAGECVGLAACETTPGGRPHALGLPPLEFISPTTEEAAQVRDAQFVVVYSSTSAFNTRIIFACDTAVGEGIPVVASIGNSGTDYIFVWRTVLACAL